MARRVPTVQVYLPDELYRAVRDRGLPATELLHDAVQAELRHSSSTSPAARPIGPIATYPGDDIWTDFPLRRRCRAHRRRRRAQRSDHR
jgi:post-segregation antitoxin (ccd killing protein)